MPWKKLLRQMKITANTVHRCCVPTFDNKRIATMLVGRMPAIMKEGMRIAGPSQNLPARCHLQRRDGMALHDLTVVYNSP